MNKQRIFIDAGHNHSGFNTGAVGNGMKEQDITFEVAKHLQNILKNDFEIKLSRPTNETNLGHDNNSSINTRVNMSNAWGADYFISIHVNAAGGTGAETFYWGHDAKKFATTIQKTYAKEMSLRDRRTEATDRFGVIRNTNCPAILIELAFIDAPQNKSDLNILRYKRNEMAQAVAKGIYKYFKIEPIGRPSVSSSSSGTVDIEYRGKVYQVKADNINGGFISNIGELSKVFGDLKLPIRATLEQAGLRVDWNEITRTVKVT